MRRFFLINAGIFVVMVLVSYAVLVVLEMRVPRVPTVEVWLVNEW